MNMKKNAKDRGSYNLTENGLFLIKDERFEIKDGKVIHTYKACGDVGYAKEYMYMLTQSIIDRLTDEEKTINTP